MIEKFDANQKISNLVTCFVHRDEKVDARVVRILPELRPNIQIILGDDYWLKSTKENSTWENVPKIAFWAPKYDWCYGFSKNHIKVFGLAITADMYKKISNIPLSKLLNKVIPLSEINSELAVLLSKNTHLGFCQWKEYVADIFETNYKNNDNENLAFNNITQIFAKYNEVAIVKASQINNLSLRQFRRKFKEYFGTSPKQYQRVMRIDRMIRSLHDFPWEVDEFSKYPLWFADQAHAIREFKSLTGITPRQYLVSKKNSDSTLRSVYVDNVKPPHFY